MSEQSYLEFAWAVSCYLEEEWPAAALAIGQSREANRAAVRATLDAFMAALTPPRAAGEVAFAVAAFVTAE